MAVNPHDIPNGYSIEKHKALSSTIVEPNDIEGQLRNTELKVMTCHETERSHCVGWLYNQLGSGNNIALRIAMMSYENAGDIEVFGEQHKCFQETLR
ncbi:hypothetical protein BM526_19585 (plasmid) [Alteromonas mediterranea]|uniref:hypothetical protein n=1 Tax=Alteromonas mediterranea TaxID=314275 RepID=UPI00090353F1|nr:hypothetical protein [Alteromonas mediterranea]APE04173.1 hypothetical protein BM526_19585 [Alteromonas mediterranea]